MRVTRSARALARMPGAPPSAGASAGTPAAEATAEADVFTISVSLLSNHGEGQVADWYVGALIFAGDDHQNFSVVQLLPDGR